MVAEFRATLVAPRTSQRARARNAGKLHAHRACFTTPAGLSSLKRRGPNGIRGLLDVDRVVR
jgi:hypothetical protein